jgi:AcrR family transcriptional regulator
MGRSEAHREAIRERKLQERERRIRSILDAAKRLFFLKGYQKMTMDDIALEVRFSKPTIYQYFKSKDELFFKLLTPASEKTEQALGRIEQDLLAGGYRSGAALLHDTFQALYGVYRADPEAFRILQLFQHSGMVGALNDDVRRDFEAKARITFEQGRRILRAAMEQGLIRRLDVHPLNDVVWALFVGIIQLEDTKAKGKEENPFLRPTLEMAERLIIMATAADVGDPANPHLKSNPIDPA